MVDVPLAELPSDTGVDVPVDLGVDLPAPDVAAIDVPACPDGLTLCGTRCVNLNSALDHCGSCENVCPAFLNGEVSCEQGVCLRTRCLPGFANCDGEVANGCEVDLGSTALHCGACGAVCAPANASGRCRAGRCEVGSCAAGYADCNGDPSDGCEVDTRVDLHHCGACGRACTTPNGSPSCAAGVCGTARCDAGFADCDGRADNGCETAINTDVRNCTRCGNVCPTPSTGSSVCLPTGCGLSACASGRADCDGMLANGCETDLGTISHCGACTNACRAYAHATAACEAGSCRLGACNDAYGNCDGSSDTGCETSLLTDVNHCGACGHACAFAHGAAQCAAGHCVLGACAAGFANCNNDPSDGCETDLSSTDAACGACGTTCLSGFRCTSGSCLALSCVVSMCGAGLIDLCINAANCGACGRACDASSMCVVGACVACAAGSTRCGLLCVDTRSSLLNCGSCGTICPLTAPLCVNGRCRGIL